jgi:hypothetical protein
MELQLPSWFKYRQGAAEPAGRHCYKLTAPLADEAFIRINAKDGRWQAALANSADGPDTRATEPVFDREVDAWNAAFELYRSEKIY